jgi:tetratricopeptide (TPR) repeat protein
VRALGNLGTVEERRGRYEQAVRCHQQSLALARKLGDRRGESYALMNLGRVGLLQDRGRSAIGQIQRALVMFREVGDRNGEAEALTRLGGACQRLDRYEEAVGHHRQALVLFREIGDRQGEADALDGLAEVQARLTAPDRDGRAEAVAQLPVGHKHPAGTCPECGTPASEDEFHDHESLLVCTD